MSPIIIIDTREQRLFLFDHLPAEQGTLNTGDYSVRGLEHLVAIERKSLPDLLVCVGRERERFIRELQRLRAYRFRMVIVEAVLADIEIGGWRSQLKPSHVLGSLAAWQARFELPIVFAGDHAAAGRFTERFLHQAARVVAKDYSAAAAILGAQAERKPSP